MTLSQQSEQDDALVRGWLDACVLPPVDRQIRAIHDELADEVARRKPVCISSGRCCHFEAYGHRLYVTGLETAWTLSQLAHRADEVAVPTVDHVDTALAAGTCPFLQGTLCSIHTIKPMACRLFFCDATATRWQAQLYERLQGSIVRIHEDNDIPYRYGEWTTMLRQCTATTEERARSRATDPPPASEPTSRQHYVQVRLT